MKQLLLENKKCIISLHEAIPIGPTHELRKFLLQNRVNELLFIAHPLIYIKEFYKKSSKYEFYTNGKLAASYKAYHWKLPEVFLYAKDFCYTIYWSFSKGNHYDVFFWC